MPLTNYRWKKQPVPVDILVTGSVPAGSGLSSSAAMVVASTLAFLAVNDKLDVHDQPDGRSRKLTKGELVEMAVENEKRVGVNSGGYVSIEHLLRNQLTSPVVWIKRRRSHPFPLAHCTYPSTPPSPSSPSHSPSRAHNPPPSSYAPTQASSPTKSSVRPRNPSHSFSHQHIHSLTGARTRYNLRVVETLVAARIFADQLHLTSLLASPNKKFTLRELVSAYLSADEVKGNKALALSPEELEGGLKRLLDEVWKLKASALRGEERPGQDEEGLTMDEMVRYSGLSKEEFDETYLSWVDSTSLVFYLTSSILSCLYMIVEATHFQLYKRTKHVLAEALRVLQFRSVCLASSQNSQVLPESILLTLGTLMNDSQESCKEFFECSCPELDELTAIAREAGAYGSRLTGGLDQYIYYAMLRGNDRCGLGRLHNLACRFRVSGRLHCQAQTSICAVQKSQWR